MKLLPKARYIEVKDWRAAVIEQTAHVIPWDSGTLDYYLAHEAPTVCPACYLLPIPTSSLPPPTYNAIATRLSS